MEEVKNIYDKLNDRNKDLIDIATRAMLFAEKEIQAKKEEKENV